MRWGADELVEAAALNDEEPLGVLRLSRDIERIQDLLASAIAAWVGNGTRPIDLMPWRRENRKEPDPQQFEASKAAFLLLSKKRA